MSDIVSGDDGSLLAAEYVLGTLDADERTHANARLDADEKFRAMVSVWERRLGELHLMVEPVEPDPQIWPRILQAVAPSAAAPVEDMLGTLSTGRMPAGVIKAEQVPDAKPVAAETGAELESAVAEPQAAETAIEIAGREPQAPDIPHAKPLGELPLPEPSSEGPSRLLKIPHRDVERDLDKPAPPRRPGVGRWRAFACLMTAIAAALAGLIAAWRYVPERLPPQLRPTAVLNIAKAPSAPAKKSARPEAQFEE